MQNCPHFIRQNHKVGISSTLIQMLEIFPVSSNEILALGTGTSPPTGSYKSKLKSKIQSCFLKGESVQKLSRFNSNFFMQNKQDSPTSDFFCHFCPFEITWNDHSQPEVSVTSFCPLELELCEALLGFHFSDCFLFVLDMVNLPAAISYIHPSPCKWSKLKKYFSCGACQDRYFKHWNENSMSHYKEDWTHWLDLHPSSKPSVNILLQSQTWS